MTSSSLFTYAQLLNQLSPQIQRRAKVRRKSPHRSGNVTGLLGCAVTLPNGTVVPEGTEYCVYGMNFSSSPGYLKEAAFFLDSVQITVTKAGHVLESSYPMYRNPQLVML